MRRENTTPGKNKAMRILIAADKFKGSLTSFEACAAIAKGLGLASTRLEIIQLPLADGGEGLLDVMAFYIPSQTHSAGTLDPLLRPMSSPWLLSADGRTAVVEMAKTSGLQLLDPSEYDCLASSTFGTGQLIGEAIRSGAEEIVIGIGGSATNDGGIGMAAALGFRFLDKGGKELPPVGGSLIRIGRIDVPRGAGWGEIHFRVACDVTSPLYGPRGATRVYAPQKGASPETVELLEAGMLHYAGVLERDLGIKVADRPGAGAAGGLGAGCMAFLKAEMVRGVDLVIEYSRAGELVRDSDLVITGEGKMDGQTLQGKLVAGIAALGGKYNKPVLAVCGTLELSPAELQELGIAAAFPLMTGTMTLEYALRNAVKLLVESSFHIGPLLNTFISADDRC
jgi:glycerate kinase